MRVSSLENRDKEETGPLVELMSGKVSVEAISCVSFNACEVALEDTTACLDGDVVRVLSPLDVNLPYFLVLRDRKGLQSSVEHMSGPSNHILVG